MSLLATAALLWSAASRAAAPPAGGWRVEVEAEHVVVADAEVTGTGEVVLVAGEQVAQARAFRLDTRSGLLVLEEGRLGLPDGGSVTFERAEVDLEAGTAVFLRARYEGLDLVVIGARVEARGEGRLAGESVTLSVCGCEPPLWSVEAAEVQAEAGGVARFRVGWVRLCDQRVLPVPAGAIVLASRRSGLLPPELGWGRDGVVLGQPAVVVLGPHADGGLEAEWRQERGARALADLRYALRDREGGVIAGALGWDRLAAAWRGGVQGEHAWTTSLVRTAARGRWTSDDAYLSDFGDDFLARREPWSEVLGVVGVGSARLETDVFQATDVLGQRPLAGVLAWEGRRVGPVATGAAGRVDLVGEGGPGDAWGDAVERLGLGGWAEGGRELGLLAVRGRNDLRAVRWRGGSPWLQDTLGAEASLPLWGDLGRLRHLAEVGVHASGSLTLGDPEVRLLVDRPAPAWALGPLLESRWLAPGGVPLSGRASLAWTPEGWRPEAFARAGTERWAGRFRLDTVVQEGVLIFDDEGAALALGAARFDPDDGEGALLQGLAGASLRLPGALSGWRPGWSGLADLAAGRLVSHTVSLAWSSRCRCLSVRGGATWSEDRAVPDLALQVDLR